ncbi:MAG TPA: hypothetical protein EYQ63_18830 [Fuerstia sp.]|nr:hypothetical protein [Fuerstiella sp.]
MKSRGLIQRPGLLRGFVMNEHTENNDRLLQRSLTDALGPEPLRDKDIERLLDAESAVTANDEQLNRILDGARTLVEQSASHTVGNRWAQDLSGRKFSGAARVTMRRISDRPQDSRNRNPRGAVAALTVAAMSLLAVLFWTSKESLRFQTVVAEHKAERQLQIASIRRHWMTAQTVPVVESTRVSVGDVIRTGARERRRVNLPDGSVLYVNESAVLKVVTARKIEVQRGEVFVEVVPQFDPKNQRELFEVVTPTRTVTALGTKFGVDTSGVDTEVLVTQGKVKVSGVKTIIAAGKQLVAAVETRSLTSHTVLPALRASEHLGWTRDLMVAAAGALVPASDYAGGAIITVDPNGQETKLSLRKYHVDVHIEDGFARTTIDQTYFNHTQSRLEGTFHFPLPPDASLSRLAMYVNGKLMEGGMAEREHARNTFEKIVHKMKDPALLEWVDGSTFKMRVFPLEARQEKRIVLSYTQRLNSAYGKTYYRFPAGHSMDVVRDWSTSLRVKNGGTEKWHSPSHAMTSTPDGSDLLLTAEEQNSRMDRDLVLELGAAGADELTSPGVKSSGAQWCKTTHGGHQYLLLRYRPELPGKTKRSPRHWVFLFEASADRNPLLARTQIEIIRTLLDNAEHSDTFNIVTANTKAIAFSKNSLKCSARNIAKAKSYLDQIHLIGALDLQKALTRCGELCDSENETVVVHTGSAIPVLGTQDQSELLKDIPVAAGYVGVGVGKLWSRPFMKEAASRSGGYFTQINPDEEVRWRAFELSSLLNTPRLLNVKVAETGTQSGEATFLNFADTIVQGEEICAVTRCTAGENLPKSVVVTGLLNGKPWKRTVKVKRVAQQAEHLPRSWAKLQIDRLIADGAVEHKNEIIRLSKSMYVMSPFTSLLVLENEEMYTQHNIDRGRKDHWALYACPAEIKVVEELLTAPAVVEVEKMSEPTWQDTVRALSMPRVVSWSSWDKDQNGALSVNEMLRRNVSSGAYRGRPTVRFRQSDSNVRHTYPYYSSNIALRDFGVTDGRVWFDDGLYFDSTRTPLRAEVEYEQLILDPTSVRDEALNLRGDVNVKAILDIGPLIIKGDEADVASVQRVIRELEQANVGVMPEQQLRAAAPMTESSWGSRFKLTLPTTPDDLSGPEQLDGLARFGRYDFSVPVYSVDDLVALPGDSVSFVPDLNFDGYIRSDATLRDWGIPVVDNTDLNLTSPLWAFRPPVAIPTPMRAHDVFFGEVAPNLNSLFADVNGTGNLNDSWVLSPQLNLGPRIIIPEEQEQQILGVEEFFSLQYGIPQQSQRSFGLQSEAEGLPKLSFQRDPTSVDGERQFLRLTEQFEDLYGQRRFAEAELVAKKAQTLNVAAKQGLIMEQKAKLQRQIAFNEQLKADLATDFLRAMNDSVGYDVKLSVMSPAVKRTLGTNRSWTELSRGWGAYRRPELRRLVESERKIENLLSRVVSLHFHNAPLTDVIRHIATTWGVNIALETQAMKAKGQMVNQRVSIDVDGITLRSALNLLLAQAGGLVYDIENGVLKITTRLAKVSRDDIQPHFGRDPRYFCDLMSHAPGLNTSRADVLALAETISDKALAVGSSATTDAPKTAVRARGRITAAAKRLIDGARSSGWERITFPAADGPEAFSVLCDGAGRYVYSRIVSEGLREEVLCDGDSLTHVYSDIGLASQRTFSRFHRRTIESLVPWLVPPVAELARGADVIAIDDRTVAIVPQAVTAADRAAPGLEGTEEEKRTDVEKSGTVTQPEIKREQDSVGSAGPVIEVHFVFGDDGRLQERRLVSSESKTVVLRTVFESDGTIRMLDGDDEELAVVKLKREVAEAPALELKDAQLVVLPMPIRSSATVLKGKAVNDGEPDLSTWSKKELMALILADTAEGNGVRVAKTIDAQFFSKNDRRDGLYVLLSRFPKRLVWEEDVAKSDGRKRQVDLRPSPEGSPLRQFVRQYISWTLNADGSATEFAIEGSSDGFVQRLATARNLYQRWSSGAATNDRTTSQIRTELQRALKFVASCRTDAMGWTLLSVIHPKIEAAELNEMFARAAAEFEDNPQLARLVRQERVAALFKAGRHQKARQLYAQLLRAAIRQGTQPQIAADIRERFVSHGGQEAWSDLVVACGSALTKAKLLRTAFLFSVQLNQLGDTEAAGQLMEQVLAEVTAEKRPDVTLLAVEHLRRLADGRAGELMDSLLELQQLQNDSRMWRYAARVADDLGHRQTAVLRLEHAIYLEFQNRPDVINVEKLRAVYTDLLTRFEEIIDASATLETAVPDDMFARIIRSADQWRSLEDDATTCCHLTARILSKLNQTDLAWSYLTTPLAGQSGESAPWRTLADNLTEQKQVELADMAWSRAFEFERTNPELLLSHAKMLSANGQAVASRRLLKQIVDTNWQPRFARVQQQARNLLP